MKRLNKILNQAGVLTPATKETELLALLRDSPCTNDAASAIPVSVNSEEEISKTRNAVSRAIRHLPQWEFETKLDKASLTLYVGKFEKEPVSETTTEAQP